MPWSEWIVGDEATVAPDHFVASYVGWSYDGVRQFTDPNDPEMWINAETMRSSVVNGTDSSYSGGTQGPPSYYAPSQTPRDWFAPLNQMHRLDSFNPNGFGPPYRPRAGLSVMMLGFDATRNLVDQLNTADDLPPFMAGLVPGVDYGPIPGGGGTYVEYDGPGVLLGWSDGPDPLQFVRDSRAGVTGVVDGLNVKVIDGGIVSDAQETYDLFGRWLYLYPEDGVVSQEIRWNATASDGEILTLEPVSQSDFPHQGDAKWGLTVSSTHWTSPFHGSPPLSEETTTLQFFAGQDGEYSLGPVVSIGLAPYRYWIPDAITTPPRVGLRKRQRDDGVGAGPPRVRSRRSRQSSPRQRGYLMSPA